MTNNIAAGSNFAGFIVMAHNCGDYSTRKFKDNVAHSIAGSMGGAGALIYPDPNSPSHGGCFEGSYFAAYKCYYQGVYTYYKGQSVSISHMTMIDNRQGFGASLGHNNERRPVRINIFDNKIYGDSEISDCPKDGSFCNSVNKFGMILSGSTAGPKALHPTSIGILPVYKLSSLSSWSTV